MFFKLFKFPSSWAATAALLLCLPAALVSAAGENSAPAPVLEATRVPVLVVENTGPDSFQVVWEKIPWAVRYEVSLGTNPEADNRGAQFINTPSFSQTNLLSATTYYIRVRAIISGRAGTWSAVATATTSLPAIIGLAVDDVSDTAIHLTWPGLYTGMPDILYEISLGTDPGAASLGLQTCQPNTLDLEHLRPGTTYYIKIRLRRLLTAGPWSDPMPVATLAANSGTADLAGSKGNPLRLEAVAHTSSKIVWDETPGAEGYELAYLPVPSPETLKPQILKTPHPPAELSNLKPEQAYRVKWRALFPNRIPGNWSQELTFSTFPIPPAPDTVYLAQVTDAYVRLTWTAQTGVTAYEALAAMDELGEDGSREIVHRGSARLDALQENTHYWAKVRTLNQGGPGSWSAAVAFATPLNSAPRNLQILHLTATESAANWDLVAGNAATTYELRLAAGDGAWQFFSNLNSQSRSLDDLTPDTRYRVQVRGKNAAGFGPWSADAVFHTPPLPPQEAPKELRAEALTDVSGKILWKPLANARIYLLGLGTDTYASNRGEITVSAAGYEMKGLLPETNYFARVKAVNGAGEGPWSEMMGFTTLPSPPFNAPEGMEVMEITSHSLTLHWTPTPDAAAYEVGFGTDPQVAHAQIQSADTCSCKLAGLKPATTYTLRVRKINRGGTGPWSQSRTATTQP